MVRVARTIVGSQALAEEVVQEAWLGVIRGIDRFEGRSSLRTWIFHIVVNVARTAAGQESRSAPFSSLGPEPAVDPERFYGPEHDPPRAWAAPPRAWPEAQLEARETLGVIAGAIAGLPRPQRQVITLRDVEGWPAKDVCRALELSEPNQRVLLHRARSRVRGALELYLAAQ
jgi:RNA polymerase sigma-70 factor (ECF subfamily)